MIISLQLRLKSRIIFKNDRISYYWISHQLSYLFIHSKRHSFTGLRVGTTGNISTRGMC